MQTAIPACAERIDLLTMLKPKIAPSRFVPGIEAYVTNYACPGCGADLGELSATTAKTCTCGLIFQHTVSHIAVWRAELVEA